MSVQNILAFSAKAPTVQLPVGVASARVALPGTDKTISVYNPHTVAVFVKSGTVAVNADLTTSVPVPPGAVRNLRVASDDTHIAAIVASGTPTITISADVGGATA